MTSRPKPLAALALLAATILPACHGHKGGAAPSPPSSPGPASQGGSSLASLRYLSYALRDLPPSADEARSLAQGKAALDDLVGGWLASPEHLGRIKRYFGDLIGVSDAAVQLPFLYNLKKDAAGIYQSGDPRMKRAACDGRTAVAVKPWWLDGEQTVQVCPGLVSATLRPTSTASGAPVTMTCALGFKYFGDPACGCGPEMIACYPVDLRPQITDSMKREFGERGALAYSKSMTWLDLLGGDFLYADRYLAWWYLYTTKIASDSADPTPADIAALHAAPVGSFVQASFPTYVTPANPSGNVRAGVVTAPGFLSEFNTFRARIHGLVLALLCKDVDATLGADVTSYLNPGFSDFDRSHGVQPTCSACHFPMDNMASLDFGWGTNGVYNSKLAASQIGHAFGVDGAGPKFLAQAFIDHAPEFKTCMAKTAWQSFSGLDWADLAADKQSGLTAAVDAGPRSLISAVIAMAAFRQARSAPTVTGAASVTTLSFSTDVNPILQADCSGGACHSAGAPNAGFVGDEATFKSLAETVATRTAAGGGMPPATSGKTLTASDRQTLLTFLGK